jgi:hypothetical protein
VNCAAQVLVKFGYLLIPIEGVHATFTLELPAA